MYLSFLSRLFGKQPDKIKFGESSYSPPVLSPKNLEHLHKINIDVTRNVLQKCKADSSLDNMVQVNTNFCLYITLLGLSESQILQLTRDYNVLWPWTIQYDTARTSNSQKRFIYYPLAIVYVRNVSEVREWINLAVKQKLHVGVRSGGNSYESFSIQNQIIIDLSDLLPPFNTSDDGMTLSSGLRLGTIYTDLDKRNILLNGGICPQVAIGGLSLSGGNGYFIRKYGYVGDQIKGVEAVLSNGQIIIANERSHEDFFEACKGAGSAGIGVITQITLKTFCFVRGTYFQTIWSINNASDILEAWQSLVDADDNLSGTVVTLVAGAPLFQINGVYLGSSNQLKSLLKHNWFNLIPSIKPIVYTADEMSLSQIHEELGSEVPQPTFSFWKLKSFYAFKKITSNEFQPLIEFLAKSELTNIDHPLIIGTIQIVLMGGKINSLKGGVFPAREGSVTWIHYGSLWIEQSYGPRGLKFVKEMNKIVQPLHSDVAMYNVPDLDLGSQSTKDYRYLKAYWPNHVDFLLAVKKKYDPIDLFHFEQSLPV